jgi:hypothetical protein
MTAAQVKQYVRDTLVAQRSIAQEILVLDAIVDLVAQALTENIPEWTALLTFQTDDTDAGSYCLWPDTDGKLRFWKTKVDDNLNNEPPTNPLTTEDANWIEVSPSDGSSIKEWAAGIYGAGLVIIFFEDKLYKLSEPTRPFESTDFEAELAAGSWIPLEARSYWQGLWAWPADAWPVSLRGGDTWYTTADLADPFIPTGALLIAKEDGAAAYADYLIKL